MADLEFYRQQKGAGRQAYFASRRFGRGRGRSGANASGSGSSQPDAGSGVEENSAANKAPTAAGDARSSRTQDSAARRQEECSLMKRMTEEILGAGAYLQKKIFAAH